jgi:hypothetical protein
MTRSSGSRGPTRTDRPDLLSNIRRSGFRLSKHCAEGGCCLSEIPSDVICIDFTEDKPRPRGVVCDCLLVALSRREKGAFVVELKSGSFEMNGPHGVRAQLAAGIRQLAKLCPEVAELTLKAHFALLTFRVPPAHLCFGPDFQLEALGKPRRVYVRRCGTSFRELCRAFGLR